MEAKSAVYQRIWSDYLTKLNNPVTHRTLFLGQAARFIREEGRISRTTVSEKSKIGLSLLKAIETKKEAYSTWSNIEHLSSALNIPTDKLIQRSREEFPFNFFVQRKNGRMRLAYDEMDVFPYSPPISSQSDFLLLKIHLHPGKSSGLWIHAHANEIACFVLEGPIRLRFGNQTLTFQANQSFFFDGSVEHELINESEEKTVEFFICLNPAESRKAAKGVASKKPGLDLAYALEYVRRKASPIATIPLPWNMISEMTGIPIRALVHLRSGKTEIVYWDKLELLSQGTGIPLEEIMEVALGKSQGRLETCSALQRGTLDYGDQFGMRVYSAVRPGTARRRFFIGQVILSKRAMERKIRKRWKYKTNAFLCAIVQDGRILIEYGERKKETLTTGDSVYFDGNIDFVVHNLEHQESKLFLFSQPPLF